MSRNLKPFGEGGRTAEDGRDIDYIVGWLEAIIHDEEENCENAAPNGPKVKRLEAALSALDLLYEVSDNTG
jgi:hypothetical protein